MATDPITVTQSPGGARDPLFILARDRDAWASIRGFVYQVDLSIHRWLELGGDDVLQLERGEDIDRITTALSGDVSAAERLLEQVKQRTAPITLRSSPAREALANFAEHRRVNPTAALLFRFTTTARVGRERKTRVPGKMPGISAWQAVVRRQLDDAQQAEVLIGLRDLLTSASGPEGVPLDIWDRYQDWLATAEDAAFLDFVRRVEWLTAMPDSPTLVPSILDRLRRERPDLTADELRQVYERLFVAVFARLSRAGVKQLTRADLLAELSADNVVDRALVERLKLLHTVLSIRVEVLEQRMEAVVLDLAATQASVAVLSATIIGADLSKFGASAVVDATRAAPPPLTEPPPTPFASLREATISALLATVPRSAGAGSQATARAEVVSIHGAQASGKTQLALRVAQELGDRRSWIRLLGLSADQAGERLALAIYAIAAQRTGKPFQPDLLRAPTWEELCNEALSALNVLVLDDVPGFRVGDGFGARLPALFAAAHTCACAVVITSVHPVTAQNAGVEPARVVNTVVPPLTTEEVKDVLRARGAPDSLVNSQTPTLLRQSANGHPVLVQAIAAYLEQRQWQLSSSVLADLFGQRYATAVNNATIRTLLESVSDATTRDYLYRLSIADVEFDADDAHLLATVPPPIDRPRERFTSVVGPWVEPIGGDRYRLSQLIRALGTNDLLPETGRTCHRVLGERILSREALNELDALQALAHFTTAEEFDQSALLLLQSLHSLMQASDVPEHTSRLWRSLVVSPRASAALRLQIHAFQAVLLQRAGEPPDEAVAAMEAVLAEQPPLPAAIVFGASITVATGLALDNVPIAASLMKRALEKWPDLTEDLRQAVRVRHRRVDIGVDSVIWLVSGGIRSERDLAAWLDALDGLPPSLRATALGSSLARQMAGVVLHRLLLTEWERPVAARDWPGLARALERTAARAHALGAPPLEAAAIASQLTCLLEAQEPISGITAVAERALRSFANDSDSAFLIIRHVALGVLDRGELQVALDWLRRADTLPGALHQFDRAQIQLRLAQLLVDDEPAQALAHSERAVAIARTSSRNLLDDVAAANARGETGDRAVPSPSGDVPKHLQDDDGESRSPLLVQALGERAIVQWLTGDRLAASRTMLQALHELREHGQVDEEVWRALTIRIGHVTGYFSRTLLTGSPPEAEPSGSPYVAPRPGMMLQSNDSQIATLYSTEKSTMLGIHAMWLAEAVEDDVTSVAWAEKTVEQLKAQGLWVAAMGPLERLVRDAIERSAFDTAFEHGTDMLTAFWVMRHTPREAVSVFQPIANPRGSIRGSSGTEAEEFEALLLDHVVLPAVVSVAHTWAEDRKRGIERATALRHACETLAEEAPASSIWPLVVALIDNAFLAPVPAQALIDFGGTITDPALRTIKVLALLGASLDPRLTLGNALYLQLHTIHHIITKLRLGSRTQERIATPFFETLWGRHFQSARFRFRTPGLIAADIEALASLPPARRLKRLFQVMARGLDVPLEPALSEWLGDQDQ